MGRVTATDLERGNPDHEVAAIVALIRSGVVPAHKLATLIDQTGSAVALVGLSEDDRLMTAEDPSHAVTGAVTDEDLTAALRDVAEWRGAPFRQSATGFGDPTRPDAAVGVGRRRWTRAAGICTQRGGARSGDAKHGLGGRVL